MKRLASRLEKNPPLVLAIAFFTVIFLGGWVLSFPSMSASGTGTPFIDSLFTSTSAVCVTGLVTVTTASNYNTWGHLVIIGLIQFGGLGFVTVTGAFFMLANKRIDMKSRILIAEEKNASSYAGLVKLIRFILIATFILEGIGALLLSLYFIPEYGLKTGIWYSIFHSISAYCNAGFDIIGSVSLEGQYNNTLVSLTICALIALGGLGFPVYQDLIKKRKWKTLEVYSKLAITMTLTLILGGALMIGLLEVRNPETMMDMTGKERVLTSIFQSVTTRTAGYFTIDQIKLTESTLFLCIILMFIGGSPAGTAGGIKTTTFALMFQRVKAEVKGWEDVTVFKRRVVRDLVSKAFAISFISLAWVILITFLLTITEPGVPLLTLLYEEVSAFATVGLTRGLTPSLSFAGKVLIISSMYLGKVGPLTMAYAFSKKEKIKYKEAYGNVLVG